MAEKASDMSIFRYDDTDFCYTIKNDEAPSKLDKIIEEKWIQAENNGVLRYKLKLNEWKILEGPYKFLAQLNIERTSKKRESEDISSMSQPFNADRFNFTKLPAKEIFFDIGDGSGNDVIAANVSPIEWGHCLILLDRFKCLPQKVTKLSLFKALEFLLLSNSPYFRVIFNSLCAHASVNHLHWHFYYLKHRMLLEDIELQEFDGPLFIYDYPAKGFCLKQSWFPDGDIQNLGSWAYFVINILQENNIAHNVYITRARKDSKERIYDDIRIYIWTRKSSRGIKDMRAFIPAVCELFGHLSVRTEEEYKNLTEEKVVQLFNDVTTDVFNGIKDLITDKVANKTGVNI